VDECACASEDVINSILFEIYDVNLPDQAPTKQAVGTWQDRSYLKSDDAVPKRSKSQQVVEAIELFGTAKAKAKSKLAQKAKSQQVGGDIDDYDNLMSALRSRAEKQLKSTQEQLELDGGRPKRGTLRKRPVLCFTDANDKIRFGNKRKNVWEWSRLEIVRLLYNWV